MTFCRILFSVEGLGKYICNLSFVSSFQILILKPYFIFLFCLIPFFVLLLFDFYPSLSNSIFVSLALFLILLLTSFIFFCWIFTIYFVFTIFLFLNLIWKRENKFCHSSSFLLLFFGLVHFYFFSSHFLLPHFYSKEKNKWFFLYLIS